jgi:hypothetical protein
MLSTLRCSDVESPTRTSLGKIRTVTSGTLEELELDAKELFPARRSGQRRS